MSLFLNKTTKGKGKVFLADDQRGYQSGNGFSQEAAEGLPALAAEIATIDQRHSALLMNNSNINSLVWTFVDAFGRSQIGFWPIFKDDSRFVVVIAGILHFNYPDFITLIVGIKYPL